MKFKGSVEFEWVKEPNDICLYRLFLDDACLGGVRTRAFRDGFSWDANGNYGTATTLEEAKAALLADLGIAVESELPQEKGK